MRQLMVRNLEKEINNFTDGPELGRVNMVMVALGYAIDGLEIGQGKPPQPGKMEKMFG